MNSTIIIVCLGIGFFFGLLFERANRASTTLPENCYPVDRELFNWLLDNTKEMPEKMKELYLESLTHRL